MSLFSLISLLIALAAVSSYINYRFIKLPTTIGVMLVALVASLVLILAAPYTGGFREQVALQVKQINFDQLVLHGLLAFLLFAGSIHVNLEELGQEWLPIFLLAVVGTLVSTAIVGSLTWLLLNWLGVGIPFLHAMLFGALISPTDPIAVLGIMKSVGAPPQLEVQMAGESLFNDGVGVVVFLLLLEISGLAGGGSGATGAAAEPFGALDIARLFFQEVGGGLVIGLLAGYIAFQMLKSVDKYQVEVLLTLALAMGLYSLADSLHLSAPIAAVVAGLFIGNEGRASAMTDKTRMNVDTFWELIDEILNVVLFLLIGLELLVIPLESRLLLAGAITIPVVLLARWLSVAGILGSLGRFRNLARGAIPVLTWGGLRGAISVALVLSLPSHDSRSVLLVLTYCVVVFSILVQGLTLGRVIRRTTKTAVPAEAEG